MGWNGKARLILERLREWGGNALQMVIRQVKKNDTRCGCNANNQQKM